VITIAILAIVYCFYGINNAWSESRHFWITFHNLTVNDRHDPLDPDGDWAFLGHVNEKQINFFESTVLSNVENTGIYSLDNQSVEIEIPENGTIKMVTTGFERDTTQTRLIPNISNLTKALSAIPATKDAATVADSVHFFVTYIAALNGDDPLGIITKDFENINDFGNGTHIDASCFRENPKEQCEKDYVLAYSVSEYEPLPDDSLIAELFVYEDYTGPNTIIRNNTAILGNIFQNSISSINVSGAINYAEGALVQVCDKLYFGENCLNLGPGEYNIDYLSNFGLDQEIESVRFIRVDE
jgi:hypothetical protein